MILHIVYSSKDETLSECKGKLARLKEQSLLYSNSEECNHNNFSTVFLFLSHFASAIMYKFLTNVNP